MQDIYAQHQAAFNRVSAFVILKGSERVATVAIKFPADGAGRLYAYVHWMGSPMVRGHANGYGYDKRSAAVASAAAKITQNPLDGAQLQSMRNIGKPLAAQAAEMSHIAEAERLSAFVSAFAQDGNDWTRALEQAGFTVFQAV